MAQSCQGTRLGKLLAGLNQLNRLNRINNRPNRQLNEDVLAFPVALTVSTEQEISIGRCRTEISVTVTHCDQHTGTHKHLIFQHNCTNACVELVLLKLYSVIVQMPVLN
jgi:hypothetical protein